MRIKLEYKNFWEMDEIEFEVISIRRRKRKRKSAKV